MSPFFAKLLGVPTSDSRPVQLDSNPRAMLCVALLGTLCICAAATAAAPDVSSAAYRITWIVIGTFVLWSLSAVSHVFQQQTCRKLGMAFFMVVLQMLILWMISFCYNLVDSYVELEYIRPRHLLLVMPYMLAPVTVTVLAGRPLGVYTALACALFGVAMFPVASSEVAVNYLIISLLAGVVSTNYARYEKRSEPLVGGIVTGLIVYLAVVLLNYFYFDGTVWRAKSLSIAFGVTMGVNLLTVIIFAGALPVLETLSSLFTPMTWKERADTNHPLLSKLKETAPGTYSHCQEVSLLAKSAAVALKADADMVEACALFHDIGKLQRPEYFSENIADQSQTPHSRMTPEASARIILGHVDDGVKLAQANGLESRIVDVIREHHGRSLVYFFYRKACDLYDEAKRKFDEGLTDTCPQPVDRSVYSYKGPIPQSCESAIVSMADAVESATRSLNHATEDDYRNMIENIFRSRILDGHLNDCGLTLGEIDLMKEALIKGVCASHHGRIQYPEAPKNGGRV